ncbi:MAG: AMP-binding protein, partial [Pseudomonadota bacterium]
VIDELYHGYVARDFVERVSQATKIEPLPFARDCNFRRALAKARQGMEESHREAFAVVAVCIVENVITQDLVRFESGPELNPIFHQINRDHLRDEGRHAVIFTELIRNLWSSFDEAMKSSIQPAIAVFVEEWLNKSLAKQDDSVMLKAIGVADSELDTVIADTYPECDLSGLEVINPTIRHIDQWLRRAGLWTTGMSFWDCYVSKMKSDNGDDTVISSGFRNYFKPPLVAPVVSQSHGYCSVEVSRDLTFNQIGTLLSTYLCQVLDEDKILIGASPGRNVRYVRPWSLPNPSITVRDLFDESEGCFDDPHFPHASRAEIPVDILLENSSVNSDSLNHCQLKLIFDTQSNTISGMYDPRGISGLRVSDFLVNFAHYAGVAHEFQNTVLSSLPLVPDRGIFFGGAAESGKPLAMPAERSVVAMLHRHARLDPDRVFLKSKLRSMTYSEASEFVLGLGQNIAAHGWQPGSYMGVHVVDRFDFVLAMLAVMQAGYVAVPLPHVNVTDGVDKQVERMTQVVELKAVVCDDMHVAFWNLEGSAGSKHKVFAFSDLMSSTNKSIDKLIDPHDDACVLLTSGSSGAPKGIRLRHDDLCQFAYSAVSSFPMTSSDALLFFSNLCFDASLAEIVNALAAGATLVVPSLGIIDSYIGFQSECETQGVSVLNLPAGFWNQMTRDGVVLPRCVKTVLVYGESLSLTSLSRWYELNEHASLINTYGPTEATIGASFCHLDQFKSLRLRHQLIGKPFPGRKILVLDEYKRPLPLGAEGEIYIGGLALNGTLLTQESVTPVAHVHSEFGSLYATGDRGRWLPVDGHNDVVLEYCGRDDGMVKVRGYRVDTRAIERALNTRTDVEDAIVIPEARDSSMTLRAFVKTKNQSAVGDGAIEQYLAELFPPHARPATIDFIDRWPLTARGKVDRQKLLSGRSLQQLGSFDAARCDIGRDLRLIWRALLRVEKLDDRSHFFNSGGHSLLAMALVSKVSKQWNVPITLKIVIENPIFSDMTHWIAAAIDYNERDKQAPSLSAAGQITLSDEQPVTFGQQSILIADRLSQFGSPQFNVAFTVPLDGAVDVELLNRALNMLLDRQSGLRTVFSLNGGAFSQRTVPLQINLKFEMVSEDEFGMVCEADARLPHSLFT